MTFGTKKCSSKLSQLRQNCLKKLVSYDLNDPDDPENLADVKKQLHKMELLEKKLEVLRHFCVPLITFSVAISFLIWYFSECWTLPFQKSLCNQPRDLPSISANQSTLADAVDEFILALRAQIAKFRNTIEIPHLTERQALSNTSKNEIGPLFSKYSEDLVAFAALKREDERLKEVEEAIAGGFIRILPFYIKTIICVCMYYVGKRLKERDHHQKIDNQILSAEESKNFHNRRLRQLEKRIPLLYIATFISIPLEVAQFFALFDGHCYGGNSPSVKNDSWNAKDCSNPVDSNNCTFTDYPNYAANLETILYRQIDKLDNYTASPLIEVRQMAWMKEGGVIDAAIENHLDLKQYNVDRRTMPRKIGIRLADPMLTIALIFMSSLCFFLNVILFLFIFLGL